MKHICELRMGPPKSGKTVAVVGTYPKPMLVLLFDKDGLDVIPAKIITGNGLITLDITYDKITFIKPDEIVKYCKMKPEELPPVLAVDFNILQKKLMTEKFEPLSNAKPYIDFFQVVNYLVTIGCPWKTAVLDSVTTLCDSLMSFVAEKQNSWLSDARKWSPAVGSKVLQHVSVMSNIPVHKVFIAHSHMEKNELSGDISIIPLGPNRLSEQIGSLVSQYFYATNETGKLEIWTRPKGNVKAIGCRWPSGLSREVSADFKSIYGGEI